ncbi:uncharacterized protein LOC108962423 [Serinus canaria]|uniref:uncharacterized protein LOC108962423 n=1 Tax=Serinus canaria TaxID=9135 RepID=UPI0021CCC160|nr:uncharacterized protein LOC108962423 [Serinus canaria]
MPSPRGRWDAQPQGMPGPEAGCSAPGGMLSSQAGRVTALLPSWDGMLGYCTWIPPQQWDVVPTAGGRMWKRHLPNPTDAFPPLVLQLCSLLPGQGSSLGWLWQQPCPCAHPWLTWAETPSPLRTTFPDRETRQCSRPGQRGWNAGKRPGGAGGWTRTQVSSGEQVANGPELALLGHLQCWGQLWAPPDRRALEGLEHVQGREQSWDGNGAPGKAERAGKGLSLEKRRLRGDPVALHKSLTGGDSQGEQGQEEREQPPAGPGEAQGGHQQEFPHGKGAQALELPGGFGEPILEVPKELLVWPSVPWAGDRVGTGHSVHSMAPGALPPRWARWFCGAEARPWQVLLSCQGLWDCLEAFYFLIRPCCSLLLCLQPGWHRLRESTTIPSGLLGHPPALPCPAQPSPSDPRLSSPHCPMPGQEGLFLQVLPCGRSSSAIS